MNTNAYFIDYEAVKEMRQEIEELSDKIQACEDAFNDFINFLKDYFSENVSADFVISGNQEEPELIMTSPNKNFSFTNKQKQHLISLGFKYFTIEYSNCRVRVELA